MATRKILRIKIGTTQIKEYGSVKEAALDVGRTPSNISRACNWRRSCAGYMWWFKDDYIKFKEEHES